MDPFEFKAFLLTKHSRHIWDCLLDLNGGGSAPWIIEAPGKLHDLYVCCLVLTSEPKRKKPEGENRLYEIFFTEAEWGVYYTRIAIIVPVAVQSGIAMAQGIKRLDVTCPCEDLKRLGIALLAHAVRHFDIEYLFLSPIDPFRKHVQRELYVNGVPFGDAGYRSLCWMMRETENTVQDKDPALSWIDIRTSVVFYTRKDKFRRKDAVVLTITPQPCAERFKQPDYLTGGFRCFQAEYTTKCPPAKRRVLLLNEGFYFTQVEGMDPDYTPPPPLPLQTHDFLWFIAGEGVMVVHGPSLAAVVCK